MFAPVPLPPRSFLAGVETHDRGYGAVEVVSACGSLQRVIYAIDGGGTIAPAPWPLRTPTVSGVVLGFAAERYPDALQPVPTPFVVEPA